VDVEDGANEGTEEDDCEDDCQTAFPLVVGLVAWDAHRLHEVIHHRLVADWEAHDVGEVEGAVRDMHSTQTERSAIFISLTRAQEASRFVCIAIASDVA
jgi:hypothetical protein